MLIGNQFDSYTLWRPATRSDPVAILSIRETFLVRTNEIIEKMLFAVHESAMGERRRAKGLPRFLQCMSPLAHRCQNAGRRYVWSRRKLTLI